MRKSKGQFAMNNVAMQEPVSADSKLYGMWSKDTGDTSWQHFVEFIGLELEPIRFGPTDHCLICDRDFATANGIYVYVRDTNDAVCPDCVAELEPDLVPFMGMGADTQWGIITPGGTITMTEEELEEFLAECRADEEAEKQMRAMIAKFTAMERAAEAEDRAVSEGGVK